MNSIKNFFRVVGVVIVVFILSSCRSKKEVTYFQLPEDTASHSNNQSKNVPEIDSSFLKPYDPVIRQNDILEIFVSSINPEATSFFNPVSGGNPTVKSLVASNPEIVGYLVDVNGEIELPLVGAVKVAGLTVPMIRDTLKQKLEKYLEKPSVRVVFQNFKVTVLGEVEEPGVYTVSNGRITFTEAIGLAGDLTIYGERKSVMIIREGDDGKKEFATVDMTNRKVFESPYYFLHPNDVVYVGPVSGKVASSDNFFRWYPLLITTLTFISVMAIRFGN